MSRFITIICLLLILPGKNILGQVDTAASLDELLDLSLEQLMDIKVVTASGHLQPANEAPSTISVITAQQIAERGYEQLEDALRDVAGIDMIHINGYAPTLFYFRGMYGAENLRALLMIDGIVENNILGSNDMAGPVYSLHNAERIEIIWGPVSALYGANAFGGVINIITKKGKDINGLKAEQGFGSFNTSFTKLNMGLAKSNLEFAIAGTLYSTDGPRFTNRDPNYAGSYIDKGYSFNATMSYHGKKAKTTLGYRTYRTPMGWGTYSNSPTNYLRLPAQGNQNLGIVGVLSRNFRGEAPGLDDAFLRTAFLSHENKISDKLSIMARITYRETGTGDDSYIYVTADGRRMIRALVATFSNRIAGEITTTYSPFRNHQFSAGLQYFQDNVEAGQRQSKLDLSTIYLNDGRDTVLNLNSTFLPRVFDIRNNLGGYLQYDLKTNMLGKTNFTVGVRFDHNSYFGSATSPRIAIINQPTTDLTLKFQVGKAFRAPSNLEIYQARNSNFPLKQEQIKTYEFNVIYRFKKNIQLQLNGFHNQLTDVIILGDLTGLNPNKNPGKFRISGLEIVTNLQVTQNLTGFLNFTFQDATGKNLNTGYEGRLPGVARVKGNAGLTAKFERLLLISPSVNWVGKRNTPRTDPYGPVKGYALTNINIKTVPLFNQNITASLTIHNLLNVKWLDPGFRTADGLLYSTVLEQPGINGVFKITVEL